MRRQEGEKGREPKGHSPRIQAGKGTFVLDRGQGGGPSYSRIKISVFRRWTMPEKGHWLLDNPWLLLFIHVALFVILYLAWGWMDIARVPRGQ
jgi:hypothetical protein